MKLYGVSESELAQIVARVSRDLYRGNLRLKQSETRGVKSQHVVFTLDVKDSSGCGARRSHQGRRMISACWHAHRDVMRGIFEANPNARLTSSQADYRGVESFHARFEATGTRNIGSVVEPLSYQDACDCCTSAALCKTCA